MVYQRSQEMKLQTIDKLDISPDWGLMVTGSAIEPVIHLRESRDQILQISL